MNLIISQTNTYYQVIKNTSYIGVDEPGAEPNPVQKHLKAPSHSADIQKLFRAQKYLPNTRKRFNVIVDVSYMKYYPHTNIYTHIYTAHFSSYNKRVQIPTLAETLGYVAILSRRFPNIVLLFICYKITENSFELRLT
jgi:hypothetical protein